MAICNSGNEKYPFLMYVNSLFTRQLGCLLFYLCHVAVSSRAFTLLLKYTVSNTRPQLVRDFWKYNFRDISIQSFSNMCLVIKNYLK